MNEFAMLASQGYPMDRLMDMAGADYYKPGDECPDCGAPGFECMGEHDTYAAAKEHDEQVADDMAPTYKHDDLPF